MFLESRILVGKTKPVKSISLNFVIVSFCLSFFYANVKTFRNNFLEAKCFLFRYNTLLGDFFAVLYSHYYHINKYEGRANNDKNYGEKHC